MRLKAGPAWAILISAVTVYELCADTDELLTAACERTTRRHPVAVRAAVVVTAAHLLGVLPISIDPFHAAAVLAQRFRVAQEATVPTT
ncbi:hypothetical protein [Nocardia sp. NPDC060249]|uniref:DUF7427 family protein n=1 Tax=Nocardia sp. NPDC060249 TaxID=3347082 RepID=UPI003648118F